jgi:hypothetical protein
LVDLNNSTVKVALLVVMAAVAIASNYLLIGVVNVKFMDLIVFACGYVLGPSFGGVLGAHIWLVYGTLNPYGFELFMLATTMTMEGLIGVSGGVIRGVMVVGESRKPDLRLSVIGFSLTFVYDVVTNIVSALTVGIPIPVAMVTGIPFMLVHELSNAVFFGFGGPPLINSMRKVLGERMNG